MTLLPSKVLRSLRSDIGGLGRVLRWVGVKIVEHIRENSDMYKVPDLMFNRVVFHDGNFVVLNL